ncbi:MAG TPA: hypothetical protein VKQ32_19605, partial [Polyangia bacterium]|nr:hypothetical protein [Polyangia bacterium]
MTTSVPSLRALIVAVTIAVGCARGAAPAGAPGGKPTGVIHVAHPGVTPFVRDVVIDPDRLEADRALDGGRHPEELLAFLEVAPGMRFGELGAGGGYTTELVARAVGERGRVYAQNSRVILERFAAKP